VATPEQSLGLSQLLAAVRRRRLPGILAALVFFAAAIVAASVWPPTYSSTGTILIEQQELPADLVRSTVSTYASQRVQIITQRVMTTDNLTGIIDRYKLYAEMRGRKPREQIISKMRRAVNLQMISADVIDPRDGRPTKATIAFSLTFSDPSAQRAAQVANELVSLYLQQNIEQRQKSSHDAVAFLSGERTRLSAEIDGQQVKLAAYKAKHENELPELSQFNQSNAIRIEDEIRDTDTRIQSLEQQLLYLDSQIAVINPTAQIFNSTGERVQSPADLLKSVRAAYAQARALYAPDHPDVLRLKREMEGLEASAKADSAKTLDTTANDDRRQLEQAQTQLAAAKQRYSADHPDVIRLQQLVDSLQQRVNAAAARTGGSVTPTAPGTPASSASASSGSIVSDKPDPGADNPPYIQMRTQREATENERLALLDKRAALRRKLGEYDDRLARTPAVEREYAEILRDLSSAQGQYAEIRRKLMEADVADNLETERKGERFSLIEPPLTPEEPASPNRPLIVAFGFVLGIAAGLGTVFLLEGADGSVRGRKDLVQLLDVPPLAMIPQILTRADLALRRRRRWFAISGLVACMLLAILAVHLLYRPLDVLWAIAMRRLGPET
jgi:polysaccharide biosynthesis transport protein